MEDNTQNSIKPVVGRPFLPGQCANPGGRPKSLSDQIRKLTNNLEEEVRIMQSIARGEVTCEMKPKIADMMFAINWLADRGFGKPTQLIAGDESHAPITINFSAIVPRPSQDDIRKNGNETGK